MFGGVNPLSAGGGAISGLLRRTPQYNTAMPQPPQSATVPTTPAGRPTDPGNATAGMSQDQVRQYVTNYFASRGVTPNPTSIDYWTQKYSDPSFKGDFQYWQQRLGQADEFTGGPQGGGGGVGGGGGGGFGGGGGGGGLTPEQIMQQDPGYQFRLGQGLQGIERGAAARGTLLTGGTQKALQRYAQDYASGEFGNVFNRNLSVGQLGLGAASQAGNLGTGYATNATNLLTGNANAQGAGSLAQGNIWSSLPTDLAGLYDYYKNQNKSGVSYNPTGSVPGSPVSMGIGF